MRYPTGSSSSEALASGAPVSQASPNIPFLAVCTTCRQVIWFIKQNGRIDPLGGHVCDPLANPYARISFPRAADFRLFHDAQLRAVMEIHNHRMRVSFQAGGGSTQNLPTVPKLYWAGYRAPEASLRGPKVTSVARNSKTPFVSVCVVCHKVVWMHAAFPGGDQHWHAPFGFNRLLNLWASAPNNGTVPEIEHLADNLEHMNIYFKRLFKARPALLQHFRMPPQKCNGFYAHSREPHPFMWPRVSDRAVQAAGPRDFSGVHLHMFKRFGSDAHFTGLGPVAGQPPDVTGWPVCVGFNPDQPSVDRFCYDMNLFFCQLASRSHFALWHDAAPAAASRQLSNGQDRASLLPQEHLALMESCDFPPSVTKRGPLYQTAHGRMLCDCARHLCRNDIVFDMSGPAVAGPPIYVGRVRPIRGQQLPSGSAYRFCGY
ncbi:hypothetical protein IF1G_03969 [Cordyceps javanica]|uniref:Uncharacterized protein n=1 Tax=Cordyceps javanica TaxID=43265 RepID=A0A545V4T0_9HYPO|nr:hypothetical protein IF1G_03969 [Cordyceps javanica]TQW07996.1 hypothetical protein IF2G_03872 [Cordyceps javanica]